MIEVVAGKRAPVATVIPIRGPGHVTGHLARYNTKTNTLIVFKTICFYQSVSNILKCNIKMKLKLLLKVFKM